MHLDWNLFNVYLSAINGEIVVEGPITLDAAWAKVRAFRVLLYAHGLSPFLIPTVSSHSINDIAGINSRDSPFLREHLPEGLHGGPTSTSVSIEVWPLELAMQIVRLPRQLEVDTAHFEWAGASFEKWIALKESSPQLQVFEDSLTTAPQIISREQSLLHVWSGIESLFNLGAGISFRLPLLLGMLETTRDARRNSYERARDRYKVRSAITHGSSRRVSHDEWADSWEVAVGAMAAIILRNSLPSPDTLIEGMFE